VAIRIGRLGDDPEAPFRFRTGDRVAWKCHDGTADEDVQGTITDGTCIYTAGGGPHQPPIYVVKRDDGQEFSAAEMTLMVVPSPVSKGPHKKNS
jgi:hypothetical protein